MLEGVIENLAFGGQGILRHEGLVVFIPFTAPGDKVRFRITEKRKKFAYGELIEILEKSPSRILPHCPYFGVCGGCQLQHITEEMQLNYKRQWVEDAFRRIGHLSFDKVLPVISASEWAYRRHITLHLKPAENHFQAGYIGTDHKTFVKVNCCPIFVPLENTVLKTIQEMLSTLESVPENEGKLTVFKLNTGCFLLSFQFKIVPKNVFFLKNWLNSTFSGIAIHTPEKSFSWGSTEGLLEIEGLKFHFSPTSFIQNHPEQSLSIYRQILEIATVKKAQTILDLYCGIGISSLLLSKRHLKVIGVESNANSINLAKKNSQINHISHAEFINNDVKKALPKLLKSLNPDLIILNPPRIGLDSSVINTINSHPPENIIYISCMPSTLARDLQLFGKERFTIELIQPFDMFPQTSHIETLVLINKK